MLQVSRAAYKLTPREFAMKIILDVLATTGITATAGIGTNMYLCKVAMDIVAKHIPADRNGVRIAELDEMSYRRTLWSHRPLTDFWRVGQVKRVDEFERLLILTDGTKIPLDEICDLSGDIFRVLE